MVVVVYLLMILTSILGINNNKYEKTENKKVKLVFRCDDYLLDNSSLTDSILYLFQKNNVEVTFGIVPLNPQKKIINEWSTEKLQNLKNLIKNEKVEIALHGYTHGLDREFKDGLLVKKYRSEFKGYSYEEQMFRISTGKKVLDSILNININVFIPPYNSYDDNTLRVLKKLNFNIISSDVDGSYGVNDLQYIPETFDEVKPLKSAIEKNKNKNAVIVFLFHPFIFKQCCPEFNYPFDKRVSYSEFDSFLAWVKNQNYVETYTLEKLSKEEPFGVNRLKANTDRFNLALSVAHRLKLSDHDSYNTYSKMEEKLFIFRLINILVHFLIFLIVFYTSRFLSKLMKKKIIILYSLMFIAVALMLIRYYYSPTWFMMVVLSITVLVSSALGIYKGLKFQFRFILEPIMSKKTAPKSI